MDIHTHTHTHIHIHIQSRLLAAKLSPRAPFEIFAVFPQTASHFAIIHAAKRSGR